MSNFDIKLIQSDDVDGEMSPYEKVELATEIYGWPFVRVRGVDKLVNLFKKYLFTTYGSDPSDTKYGCYIKDMIGQSYHSLEEVADGIQTEVERIEEQIINIQSEFQFRVPKDERLREIILLKVYEDNSSSMWKVNADYLLINYEGEEYEGQLFPEIS